MRRRAPRDGDDDDGAAPKRARAAGEFRRFADATLRSTLLGGGDGAAPTRAVFATCAQTREKSATADLRRMLGDASAPVRLPARGAVMTAAATSGTDDDARETATATVKRALEDVRAGRDEGSRFLFKMFPIDGAFEVGDGEGMRRACERIVRETRERSADARSKSIALAVVYNKRVDSTASVSGDDADASDVARGRAALVPKIAKACERAFKDADAECEVSVNLKDPNFVVFAQVFAALPSKDEAKSYIVAVGAAARDDGVFEVKSRGIAPVSVSAVSPRRDAAPKWMLKKALARAAAPAPDDAHR